MKFFKLGKGEKDTKEEDEREMEGEPEPIDYVLPSNIKEYYQKLRNLDELEDYQPKDEKEKVKTYEQIVDKATLDMLITDEDKTDKIVEYSNKLTDIFKGAKDEDKQMKRKAYISISKDPKGFLDKAREFYGEDLDHITETRRDKIQSLLEDVES